MARADRRRVQRAKAAAAAQRSVREEPVAPTLFFERLRRQVKWMFVLLALAFGVGYVIFGIGGSGTGLGDVLRNPGDPGNDGISISEARERIEKNPRDAEAHRELANAYLTEGETEEAILALGEYLNLRPKDTDAHRELASLYLQQAQAAQNRAQLAQLRGEYLTGSAGSLDIGLKAPSGAPVLTNPITSGVASTVNEEIAKELRAAQQALTRSEETYERLAASAPDDPNVQLELAQVAQQAGRTEDAITAYERFLKLAPDDPNAGIVRQQLKQLKASLPGGSG
jgi:tetratricopeptide (TPR) repeat protein